MMGSIDWKEIKYTTQVQENQRPPICGIDINKLSLVKDSFKEFKTIFNLTNELLLVSGYQNHQVELSTRFLRLEKELNEILDFPTA